MYVAFVCALHMFACMVQVFKFNIFACVVYARLQEMIDEIKTSMHMMIATYSDALLSGTRTLLLMLISHGI